MGAVSFITQDITNHRSCIFTIAGVPRGWGSQGWEQESHHWRHITALTRLEEKDLETALIYFFFIEIFNVNFLTDLV